MDKYGFSGCGHGINTLLPAKIKWAFLASIFVLSAGMAQQLDGFSLSSVHLSESPFYRAQQADLKYMLALDPDRLLAPFVVDAGLEPEAKPYGNWESSGLGGHIGGHYLSALSMMYAATGNREVHKRLKYMLNVLARCQQANGNGYVGGIPGGQAMWKEIAEGKIDAGNFSLNGKWVPLYNIHKLFAGLRDAHILTGNKQAGDIWISLTEWLSRTVSGLSDEQLQELLISEHGGMNEVLADLAEVSGDEKYLVLAKKFSHREILDPLLHREDALTGLHANTQIPKIIGFERVAGLSKDTAWAGASKFFWETVVHNRTVSIGGNSVREHFHPLVDFSAMMQSPQGPETCNTYNMLRLTKMLFLSEPDAAYMDYYERALYNHILSSQHPDGGFVYFTPMRPRHYRVYSRPEQGFWCCVGSGLENHGKYGELIYAHKEKDIYVNLFIPSSLQWKEKGITLEQKTGFPFEESSEIALQMEKPTRFRLYFRHPGWVKPGEFKIRVNGKEEKITSSPSSYVEVERLWKNGDRIAIALPMHTTAEYLPGGAQTDESWVSFVHGPVVLAAATDTTDLDGLRADDSRMGHVASGKRYPIDQAPWVVAGEGDDLPGKIIPEDKGSLAFSASGLIYPGDYKSLRLVPFFKVHDARYMIYWPVVKENELNDKLRSVQQKEKELLALESLTVDQVATGEQQPETEHNFKGENTRTGINKGLFWRDAGGWFSYDLTDSQQEGKVLRITCFGDDNDRDFDIFLNDMLLTTVKPGTLQGEGILDMDYDIPDEVRSGMRNGSLTVKFVAREGSATGGIYHIRLLKRKP